MECDHGFYGESCAEYCGQCRKGVTCHILDGTCPFGLCTPGYYGLSCKTECLEGYYGPNCQQTCGPCAYFTVCSKQTGECPHGCQGGWTGFKCDEEAQYWIQCNTNCFLKKDPFQPIGFSAQFRDPFTRIASYRWILSSCDDERLNCSDIIYDKSDKYSRALFYMGLEEKKNYDVEVWIYFEEKEPQYLIQHFRTTQRPVMGDCSITSTTGFSLLSKFEISCTGFIDLDGTTLTYSLYIFDHKMESDVLVISKMNPNQAFFNLYQNYIGEDSMVNVTVHVANKYEATVFWKHSMKILFQSIPQMNENIFFSDIEKKIDLLDKELKRLISLNSTDVTQILLDIKQILMEIDMKTGLDSSHPKLKQILERILSLLKHINTDDIKILIQMADITKYLTESTGQMTPTMKADIQFMFSEIHSKFASNWYKASSQQANDLSSLLIHGLGALINRERFENEGAIKGQTEKESNQQVTKLMQQVDLVINTLMKYQVPKQAPLTINTKFLSVTVMKRLPHEIASMTVTQTSTVKGKRVTGSIRLPKDISSLQNLTINTDIELKMLLFAENPLKGGADSEEITSTVLGISLNDRERNVLSPQGESEEIEVEIPNPADFMTFSKNVTFSMKRKGDKMELFQLSNNVKIFTSTRTLDKAFILRLIPTIDDARMKVLITKNVHPILGDVLEKGQIFPLPEDQIARKNNLIQDKYTLFFPENVSPSNEIIKRSVDGSRISRSLTSHCFSPGSGSCMKDSVTKDYEVIIVAVTLDLDSMNNSNLMDDRCIQSTCEKTVSFGIDVEIMTPTCSQWNEVRQSWLSDDCKVLPFTNKYQLHCACAVSYSQSINLFAGNIVPSAINWIEAEELFKEINHVVIAAVLLLWITYLILLPWARAEEESHKIKLGVLFCSENNPHHQYMYMVCIVTGWWKGAGTTAKVYLNLTGSEGSSRQFCMSHTRRKCFQTGGEDWIIITTNKSLGELQSLTICHDNTGTSPDWFLDYIVVKDLIHQKSWIFHHRNWLAMHRDVCLTTSATLVASSLKNFISDLLVKKVIIKQVGLKYLPNIPLWIGEDDEDYMYMHSVIGAHRMPSLHLKTLRVKRQKENAERQHTERIERSRWMYLGWLLSLGTSLAATSLVLHFGLMFRLANSGDWIWSIVVSLVYSALVVEPLKVLILVLIHTVYLKKPLHLEKYRHTSHQETDEEYVHEVNARKTKCSKPKFIPPSGTLLAHIRKKFELQWMINSALKDIVYYIFFLAIVLIFAHANWKIQDSFACTKTVEQIFIKSSKEHGDLSKVKDVDSMFQHIEKVILPTLDSLQNSRSTQTSSFYLVGSPRLRQLRINQNSCSSVMRPYLHNITHLGCTKDDSALEDKGKYDGTWLISMAENRDPVFSKWIYQSSVDLHTPKFWGTQGSYSGGGFVLEMPSEFMKQRQEVEKIRNSVWVDNRTRVVFFEFSLYNPNVDMFTLIMILFEFSNFGTVIPFQQIKTIKLLRLSAHQAFITLLEISIFCFAVAFSRIEINKYRKFGAKKYLTSTWNIFEILHILLSYLVSVLFIQHLVCTVSVTSRGFSQTKFINLYCIAFWDSVIQYIVAFLLFMLIIKSVKFLSIGRFPIFMKVFSKAKGQLFFFCIFSMVYFLSFTLSAVLAFGKQSENFRDVITGLFTLLHIWHDLRDICEINVLLPILYSLFIIFLFGIFCPMSFAILNHSLHLAKQTARERRPHFSIINYIKEKLKIKILFWAARLRRRE
ncbi:hypothetical protein CHS0354_028430 [Potamilus streckersoni]|uniref:PLAT domain-containing protein n=1 Tax=Potamilus streckersoni TaxID=2493646 RepID=A0AAE0SG23_9BIVA|nr:hypothetical protein CHS0354_028430 [Potamilus streckersoni]